MSANPAGRLERVFRAVVRARWWIVAVLARVPPRAQRRVERAMKAGRDPHPRDVFDALLPRGPQTRIAVVGASADPSKYGNVIVGNLMGKGYTVLPVNPHEPTILGLPAWPSLRQVPSPIHVVNIVTPPSSTRKILEEIADLGLAHVFLQDGSFDEDVLRYVDSAPFKTVYNACIMVVT